MTDKGEIPSGADKFETQRLEKLTAIKKTGIDPYGGRYKDVESAADVKARFKDDDDTQQARYKKESLAIF